MIKKYHLLPDVIVDQPKQSPSDSPVDIWYSGALRNEVLDLLSNLPFPVNQTGINSLLRHKWAEDWYRERVSLSHHALQSIGLLCTYASFSQVTKHKLCD